MGDRDREARPQRWPTLLLVAGIVGLLPVQTLRRGFGLAEEILLTARRWSSLGGGTATALEEADVERLERSCRPDPRVDALLAEARAALLPPRSAGWQRDGRFCVVPVGADRRPESLSLLLAGTVPAGEPVFSGRVLIGTTALDRTGRSYVTPILAKGARVPACAGVPGRREVRFLAIGDGGPTLKVEFPDASRPILEGDLVWAIDAGPAPTAVVGPVVGGAELGRIERGELPPGAQRDDWRVRPTVSLETLAEVAIRFPPGLPGPAENELAPLPVVPVGMAVRGRLRRGAWLEVGRELGVVDGCAVTSGPCLVGLVARSGWRSALVRRLDDPGFRCRAFVLVSGQCLPWTVEVVGRSGDRLLLKGAPATPSCDGALLVTAGSASGVPEGLVLGVLETLGATTWLDIERASIELPDDLLWVVHRPPGPWSAEG
jgi:rod shape-determining protein MreC